MFAWARTYTYLCAALSYEAELICSDNGEILQKMQNSNGVEVGVTQTRNQGLGNRAIAHRTFQKMFSC